MEENIILSKLDEIKLHIQGEQKTKINYKDYLVDVTYIPPKPPAILSIKQINPLTYQETFMPIFNKGDLSLISGMQKSRKTFFCSAIISAMIKGSYSDILFSENKCDVAYIDTEQSDYHAGKTANRIYRSCNKKFDYLKLRNLNQEQRKDTIEDYIINSPNTGFIILDGLVDLLYDFNNLKECQNTMQWLMKLSNETSTHICSVLHTNYGEDKKPRGHIGTIATQKVETHLYIEKKQTNGQSISVIYPKDTRDKDFTPIALEIDGLGVPHLSTYIEEENESTNKKNRF
jgi:hypothetical protein